jgi:hypothetical protein
LLCRILDIFWLTARLTQWRSALRLGRQKARQAEPRGQKVGKKVGPDEPFFWPSDSHYKLKSSFSFDASEDETRIHYSGRKIQLLDQTNGNLRKKPISEAEFGD